MRFFPQIIGNDANKKVQNDTVVVVLGTCLNTMVLP